MRKHTPAPWTDHGTPTGDIAVTARHQPKGICVILRSPEMFGNARLIAASPELFQIAKDLVADFGDEATLEFFQGMKPLVHRAKDLVANVEGAP